MTNSRLKLDPESRKHFTANLLMWAFKLYLIRISEERDGLNLTELSFGRRASLSGAFLRFVVVSKLSINPTLMIKAPEEVYANRTDVFRTAAFTTRSRKAITEARVLWRLTSLWLVFAWIIREFSVRRALVRLILSTIRWAASFCVLKASSVLSGTASVVLIGMRFVVAIRWGTTIRPIEVVVIAVALGVPFAISIVTIVSTISIAIAFVVALVPLLRRAAVLSVFSTVVLLLAIGAWCLRQCRVRRWGIERHTQLSLSL